MVSTITAVIGSSSGLHERPASIFAQVAAQSGAAVTLSKAGCRAVDAASVLSLLTLDAQKGDEVVLTVEGQDEDPVLDQLSGLLLMDLDA